MKRARSCTLPSIILDSLTQLQDGLNAMVNSSWRTVRTLDDWSVAITMESTELLDSYPWKWWKDVTRHPDIDNVKVELVDILHFSLSGSMQTRSMEESKVPAVYRQEITDVCTPMTPAKGDATVAAQGFVFLPLAETANAIPTARNLILLANAYRFDIVTEAVIVAADDLGFNLVAYYIAKHTLNYIRQLGGYKNGTYVKIKGGVEDNALLHECIKDVTAESTLDETEYRAHWDAIMLKVYDAFQVPSAQRRDSQYWIQLANADT